MAKRRPSGDGMVRKREDGRWEGRIVAGHKENGDPIFRYVSARTQKELTDKLRYNIEEYRTVELTEGSQMTLGEWLDRWLEEYMVPTIRESSLEGYRRYVEKHLKPRLGHKKISKVTTDDIRQMYRELQEEGRLVDHPDYGHRLSGTTIRRIHGVLHQAMDAAMREGLIPRNPTEKIALPKKNPPMLKILNNQQLERFMEEIKKDEVWHDFFYTELTTGLRRGEICGLMWSDFNETKGTLSIRRTVHVQEGGILTMGETKTGQGQRIITLPPSTAQLLAERKKHAYSQWIFPHPLHPERPVNPSGAYSHLKFLLRQAGLPNIRFHDLRHTFATHALTSGVDAKTLSGILGHTKASFTLDTYTHVTGDMHRRAAEIVGGFMPDIMVRG